jgi:hypothetical protein
MTGNDRIRAVEWFFNAVYGKHADLTIVADEIETLQAAKVLISALRLEVTELEKELYSDRTCTWTQEDDWINSDTWDTGCGERWVCEEGIPTDHNMNFCPYCGATLRQVLSPPATIPAEGEQPEDAPGAEIKEKVGEERG